MVTRTLVNDGDAIVNPKGEVLTDTNLIFQLVTEETRQPVTLFDAAADGGELIVGNPITATTNVNGLFSVELWPNNRGEVSTLYKVTLPGTGIKPFYIKVVEGEGNLSLVAAKASADAISPQVLSLFDQLLQEIIDTVNTATTVATPSANGLMSSSDKSKLDDVSVTSDGKTITPADVITKGPWVDVRSSDLATAAAYAIENNKPLFVTEIVSITAATDLSDVPEIRVLAGGGFTSSNGSTLVLPASYQAGMYQVFFGDLVVTLAPGGVAYAIWWGSTDDGVTDDSVQVQKAINAFGGYKGTVQLTKHNIGKTVHIKDNISIVDGEIYVGTNGITGAVEGPYNVDNYPINTAFQIQSKKKVTVDGVHFFGAGATSGSASANMIYVDYFYTNSDYRGTGSENLSIVNCVFDRPTRFGMSGLNIGGKNWNISGNKVILEGCAATQIPGYGSMVGIAAGFDILYDNNNSNASPIYGFIFANNQIVIDCSTQTYHGIAYKVQGPHAAVVTGNTVRLHGANSITEHGSAATHIYVEDSVVYGNTFGSGITNIASLSLQGCVNTVVIDNIYYLTLQVINYVRGSYTSNTSNVLIDATRGGYSTQACTVMLGLNYTDQYGLLTDVVLSGFRGEVYNYLSSNASGVEIKGSTITRYRYTSNSCGPLVLNNCTIYAATADSNEIYFTNISVRNCRLIGNAAATVGQYIANIYNSTLTRNTYEYNGGSYTGYIRIRTGSTTAQIQETRSSFLSGGTQYPYYNQSVTYQKSTVDTALPTGGTWTRGEIVENTYPSAAAATLLWLRVTNGTGNVLNTDWVAK